MGKQQKSQLFGTQTNIVDLQLRTTALKRLQELKNAAFYLFGRLYFGCLYTKQDPWVSEV